MTTDLHKPAPMRSLAAAAVSFAAAFGVAALGGLATAESVGTWYAGLEKPPFNPPNAVFGPVWTTLYALMAYAAWEVWRRSEGAARRRALTLYAVQLALNLAWSLIFFGLRRPDIALVDIALLLVAILLTVRAFWRIHRPVGLVLAPYVLWVAFASALNFEIWRLN